LAVVDRTRASDSERERVVDRLRAAATAGRLTVDELDERTALAYGAVTRGELAELVDDLPVTREPRPSPPPARPRRLPWFPGRYEFTVRWVAPASRKDAQADLMEFVAPPMHRFGYDLIERTPERMVFERRTFPMWTLLPAIFLFPFGLLALLIRGNERVAIEFLERRGATILIAQGVAPLPVRRAFAALPD
jgi:hypothetical protein